MSLADDLRKSLEGRSNEELDHYLERGCWPEEVDKFNIQSS